MNKISFLILALFLSVVGLKGQVVVFHEDFELPSLDDSMTYSNTPSGTFTWNINTRLHYTATSLRSDSCQVKTGTTVYMTSPSFNTVGNTYVILNFSQICKVDYLDIATIEVSNDDGNTWSVVSGSFYMGTGQYTVNGNRFNASSYAGLWQPSSNTALPQNTWWRAETFDISSYVGNVTNAKIRFKLADGGNPGPNSNKGWYLDNIKVTMAPSELIPPVITLLNPYPQGVIYSLGPFTIKAKIQDQSGIDTAYVIYSVNNGPADTAGMIHLGLDTMKAVLPMVSDSDSVCWYVKAYDNSIAHNWAINPTSSCIQFKAFGGITFPFYDPFDIITNLWTPSYGGTNQSSTWELGTPSYNSTNNAHTPPNAWDVNLSTVYGASAYCILTSPVFDFSNAVDARMSFWINYYTETSYDGTRLEYTTNGTTWNLLGTIGDPLATNWYTYSIYSSNQPAWAGGPTNGWKKCKYRLSLLNNVAGQVRFRFIFTADGSIQYDGFSIDDFSIKLPAAQDAAIGRILNPTISGCGLGYDTVRVTIVNNGLNPINGNLTASFRRSPSAPVTTEPVPGIIMPNDSLTFTFTNLIDLSTVGVDVNYNVKVWVTLTGDPNHDDDTLVKVVQSKALPLAPGVTSTLINYGNSTTITATSPYSISWYDVPTGGTPIATGPNYTTPLLYGTTIYYPQATGTNGCIGPRSNDTVYVGAAPPFDGSTLAVVAPVSGVNLTNAMIVKSRIRNYGTSLMTNFPIKYSINGQAPVTDTFSAVLNPGDTVTYTFNTPANLSAFGTYLIKTWLDVPLDANHVNDTASATVTNSMYPYCLSRADYTYGSDIGNVTVSNLNNGNALPTLNNSSSINLYTNFTTLNSVVFTRAQTYDVTISPIYSASFTAVCAKIFIDWNYDGIFDEATETAFTSGPNTSSNMIITGTLDVPVTALLGLTRMRVVLVETSSQLNVHPCGIYSYGETEDYNALIMPQLAIDAAMKNFVAPPPTYPAGLNTSCQVNIKNPGLNVINSVDIGYRLDNQPAVIQTYSTPILSNGTVLITFPAIAWPAGSHQLCAWVDLVNDSNAYNDTLCREIYGIPMDTLPFYDNFDGPTDFIATPAGGTDWILGNVSSSNFPNTAVSPPKVWATNLNMGSYTANASCILTTQFFDFSNAINAKLSFWYNSNTETSYDGTRLEYSTDGGTSWNILGSIGDPLATNWYTNNIYSSSQPAWAGSSNGWKKATYLLSAFNQSGQVRFRFVFTSDGSVQYTGTAIDEFQITIPYHIDAGVDHVYAPQGIHNAGTNLAIDVRLNNFGMDTIYTTQIKYQVANQPVVTETWNGMMKPGDSIHYGFTNLYFVPNGSYTIKIYSDLLDDANHLNDTTKVNLFGIPTFVVPFIDDFDSTLTYFYTTGALWEYGTPTSPTINSAYSPPSCWKTNLDGVYPHTSVQYLYSPRFDFTLVHMDSLKFWHWVHTNSTDWCRVEYFASDSTWKPLGVQNDIHGTGWYNIVPGWSADSSAYFESTYDLKIVLDYAIPTQFRFAFNPYSFNNTVWDGWAVDNVKLTFPKIQIDAGVISILQPFGTNIYGTNVTVTAVIKNFGWDTLYNIPVKYMVNGITIGSTIYNGTLLPNATTVVSFPPIPSPLTSYSLGVYTDVNFDTYYYNDTLSSFIEVVPPPYDIQLTNIIAPDSLTTFGDSAVVQVQIKNLGTNPVNDVPLTYYLKNSSVFVQETWHGSDPLATGQSTDFVFTQKYKFPFLGYYYLCSYADMVDDGYRENDTVCIRLESHYMDVPELNPDGFTVMQNIPNPASSITQIQCYLPHPGAMEFEMMNSLGQAVMKKTYQVSGQEYLIELDVKDVPPGVYSYSVTFDGKRLTKKLVVCQ